MNEHLPVMPGEVVEWLGLQPGDRLVDGTLGLGGHTLALLQALAGELQVLALDRDREVLDMARARIEAAGYDRQVVFAHSRFSRLPDIMAEIGWPAVNGVLLDLGVSSLQLDQGQRGFSFLEDGPLDMRMNPDEGEQSARDLVNTASQERLKRIIRDYGEEPMAGRIASRIVRVREKGKIRTTQELAGLVAGAYPPKRRAKSRNHPATKTFQALRMAVNQELEELNHVLQRIPEILMPGGRVVVIAFHSLEDRLVKHTFKREASTCICPPYQDLCTCEHSPRLRVLTKKPIRPSPEEVQANPRSRSAKLRAAETLPERRGQQ